MKKKIFALILCGILALSLCACSGNETSEPSEPKTSENGDSSLEETSETKEKIFIEYGDFEGMQALAKSIQNGELAGATVEITGVSKSFGDSYSIGEEEDGTFIGFTYETKDGNYPEEGEHVMITGTVGGAFPSFKIEVYDLMIVTIGG